MTLMRDQERRDFGDAYVAADRYDLLCHDLMRFHDCPLGELPPVSEVTETHPAALIWIMLSADFQSYLASMSPSRQTLARLGQHIADLERRIVEQRQHRSGDASASAEILYLLEKTLWAMQVRKADLDRLSKLKTLEVAESEHR